MTILVGHVIDVLKTLPAESVHVCVTSPPYWSLRAYGTEPQVWGDGWIGELGGEPTPELYVEHIVEVMREVWRVLRRDGTAWVNLGDSYAGSWGNYGTRLSMQRSVNSERWERPGYERVGDTRLPPTANVRGLKPKDLCMIPARVALALQADGWYLRSDIIWSKPNPMPESVTDRPTKSHEYLFLLSKSATYYYDQEAVREAQVSDHPSGNGFKREARLSYRDANGARGNDEQWQPSAAGRNRRSVWEIPTQPAPFAHFATWPEKLVEPMILAGTSERGVCGECGAPWVRVVERQNSTVNRRNYAAAADGAVDRHRGLPDRAGGFYDAQSQTTGWRPDCACHGTIHRWTDKDGRRRERYVSDLALDDHPVIPATVLDIFAGSGTTLRVAERLGRRSIGIELSETYAAIARRRTMQRGLFQWTATGD